MAATDQIIIDGIDVNDQVIWSILAGTVTFTPARKKLNWASSPLGDGATLTGNEDHYENAELVFTVRAKPQSSKDAALGVVHELTQKLQKARLTPGGVPMVWAPADSGKALTFYIQAAEWDEIHTSKEGGWFDNAPELVCHLYLRPFAYGQEEQVQLGWSDAFAWDESLAGGRWRFDEGSGTLLTASPPSDALIPTNDAQKRLYVPFTTGNCTVYMRWHTGTNVTPTTGEVGVILKRLNNTGGTPPDTGNYLQLIYPGGTALHIRKVVNGTVTSLANASWSPAASTNYWFEATIAGDDISLTVYADSQNPLTTDAPAALATVFHTLTGADATQFGSGVTETIRGNVGIHLDPPATNPTGWYILEYVVRGMDDVKSSEPLLDFELPSVKGHVPAEARLSVLEGGAQNQGHFEWGLESGAYDPAIVPPLILDSAVLDTSGFAGAQANGGTTYDPDATPPNMIQSDPLSSTAAVTVCSTGSQFHTGTYKVKARVTGTEGVRVRLAWQAGITPLVRNAYAKLVSTLVWQEVDLGTVIIPVAGVGTQYWAGRIEAYSPEVANGSIIIDYLELIPLERYGVAKAPLQAVTPDVFVARDGFTQASTTMNGAALDVGGTWATPAGWTIDTTNDWAQRIVASDASITAGAYAIAGTTNYVDVQVQALMDCSANATAAGTLRQGVIARYTDANNWLMAVREVTTVSGALKTVLRVYKRVAGTVTQIGADYVLTHREVVADTVVLRADSTGAFSASIYFIGASEPATPQVQGEDAALATGQALATGKIGLYDAFTATPAPIRTYDEFAAFTATPQVVLYASKSLEIRSDRAEREWSGNLWGRVPQYRGDRFFVPPTVNGTISRLACKARRLNVDEGQPDSTAFTDAITVSVSTTPRYLHPVGLGN